MEISDIETKLLAGVLSADAEVAGATVDKYFTKDAIFKHPLCMIEGREGIRALYTLWSNMKHKMCPLNPGVRQVNMPSQPILCTSLYTYAYHGALNNMIVMCLRTHPPTPEPRYYMDGD